MYIHQTDTGEWLKQDRNGVFMSLAGAIHLFRTRLKELICDYPASALDTTVCFGNAFAKEFFEDAKREHIVDSPAGQETMIFFMISKENGKYSFGYSSIVQKVEISETIDEVEKT